MKKYLSILIVMILMIGLIGCGEKVEEKVAEDIVESQLEEAGLADNVDISQNGEVVTVTTDEGTMNFDSSQGWPDFVPKEIPVFETGTVVASYESIDIVVEFTFDEKEQFEDYLGQYQAEDWNMMMGNYDYVKTGTYIMDKEPWAVIINVATDDKIGSLLIGRMDNLESALYNYYGDSSDTDGLNTASDVVDMDPDEVHEGWYDEIPSDIPSLVAWPKVTDTDYGLKVTINGLRSGEFEGFKEKFVANGWTEEVVDESTSYMTLGGEDYFVVMNLVENYLVMIIGYDYNEGPLRDTYGEAAESQGTSSETDGNTESAYYDGKWPADAPEEVLVPEFAEGYILATHRTYGVLVEFKGMTREEVLDYVDLYVSDDTWQVYSHTEDDTWITYSGLKGTVLLTLEYDLDSFYVIWEIME